MRDLLIALATVQSRAKRNEWFRVMKSAQERAEEYAAELPAEAAEKVPDVLSYFHAAEACRARADSLPVGEEEQKYRALSARYEAMFRSLYYSVAEEYRSRLDEILADVQEFFNALAE